MYDNHTGYGLVNLHKQLAEGQFCSLPSLANVAVANFDKHRLQLELVYNMASKIDNYLRANQLDLRIWPPFGDTYFHSFCQWPYHDLARRRLNPNWNQPWDVQKASQSGKVAKLKIPIGFCVFHHIRHDYHHSLPQIPQLRKLNQALAIATCTGLNWADDC